MNILIAPFVSGLVAFYLVFGNLGWAVVAMTVLIRLLLLPLIWPSLKASKAMQKLQPKLKKLREKYKNNKEALAKAQMDLYKNEGINPLSGCLPQILQIGVLILFYSAFRIVSETALNGKGVEEINSNLILVGKLSQSFRFETGFLGSDLIKTPAMVMKEGRGAMVLPLVLLLGSAAMQFLAAKMMAPLAESDKAVAEKTKDKEDDVAVAMRNQSTYVMPLVTVFLGWNFSVGVLLYWFVNSAVMLGQQVLSGKINHLSTTRVIK